MPERQSSIGADFIFNCTTIWINLCYWAATIALLHDKCSSSDQAADWLALGRPAGQNCLSSLTDPTSLCWGCPPLIPARRTLLRQFLQCFQLHLPSQPVQPVWPSRFDSGDVGQLVWPVLNPPATHPPSGWKKVGRAARRSARRPRLGPARAQRVSARRADCACGSWCWPRIRLQRRPSPIKNRFFDRTGASPSECGAGPRP